jgi:hypothetical protein
MARRHVRWRFVWYFKVGLRKKWFHLGKSCLQFFPLEIWGKTPPKPIRFLLKCSGTRSKLPSIWRPHFTFLVVNLSQRAGLETTFHFFIAEFVAESWSREHISLFYRWICRWEPVSKPHFTFLSMNLSLRAGLGTTFHFFIAKFVAESRSRDRIFLFYRGIWRRELFSEPHFTFLSENLSLRTGLETTFHFFIEKFVAENRSRNHISLFYRGIWRREPVSKPHFTFLSRNLAQRIVLGTTFHFFIEKFGAENRSRNHISLFYRRICRWEPVSRTHFTFLLINLSQRIVLEATFHFFIAEFVAESRSRSHISLFYRWICRRGPVSEPHFTFLSENLSLRAGLEATFHFFIAKFVAEGRSRDHILLFFRWICRWEPVSKPHFTFLSENLSLRAILETTFHIFIGKFVAESDSRNQKKLYRSLPSLLTKNGGAAYFNRPIAFMFMKKNRSPQNRFFEKNCMWLFL